MHELISHAIDDIVKIRLLSRTNKSVDRMASNYSKLATGSPCWQCNHQQSLRLTWVTSPLPPTEGQGSPTQ